MARWNSKDSTCKAINNVFLLAELFDTLDEANRTKQEERNYGYNAFVADLSINNLSFMKLIAAVVARHIQQVPLYRERKLCQCILFSLNWFHRYLFIQQILVRTIFRFLEVLIRAQLLSIDEWNANRRQVFQSCCYTVSPCYTDSMTKNYTVSISIRMRAPQQCTIST